MTQQQSFPILHRRVMSGLLTQLEVSEWQQVYLQPLLDLGLQVEQVEAQERLRVEPQERVQVDILEPRTDESSVPTPSTSTTAQKGKGRTTELQEDLQAEVNHPKASGRAACVKKISNWISNSNLHTVPHFQSRSNSTQTEAVRAPIEKEQLSSFPSRGLPAHIDGKQYI
ncbi:hypothetical protein M405DRAFT_879572 [Rhizopogon salebrosus TDB-379]|nr:hypothetical protein M405DRAFT_879572 [Rhizopogon salebrosus TDB-379]